ncbi:hypothetical protein TNCV_4357361 [Trichonephila clavipes]|nr:hypothetical protein TNCV_4357361 [Trichonephila clavipes]
MNRLTSKQRFASVIMLLCGIRNAYYVHFYRPQNSPSEHLIRLTMERFRTTFTLIDNSHPQRRRTVRTEEAIATVERSIEEDLNESIRKSSTEIASVYIHFMEYFAEGSWFACLQNPTRARIEAKRSSSKA